MVNETFLEQYSPYSKYRTHTTPESGVTRLRVERRQKKFGVGPLMNVLKARAELPHPSVRAVCGEEQCELLLARQVQRVVGVDEAHG